MDVTTTAWACRMTENLVLTASFAKPSAVI
jgi:hypothetical protein